MAGIWLTPNLPASKDPIGRATLGVPFFRHMCVHHHGRAVALRFASAPLLMKSAHSSWPSFGLGRSRIHVGSASFSHNSKASCSAQVPLQVPFLPTLTSLRSCVHPAKARLLMYSKAGGVCITPKEVHLKRASRPMRLTVLASLSCCS